MALSKQVPNPLASATAAEPIRTVAFSDKPQVQKRKKKCCKTCRDLDADDVFAFSTARIVNIQDRRLGIMNLGM
jgi:hypothetical protein